MISYFELLQLIKEGKEPKKIKLQFTNSLSVGEYNAKYDIVSGDFSHYELANRDAEIDNYRFYLSECFLESDMFNKKIETIWIMNEETRTAIDKINEMGCENE